MTNPNIKDFGFGTPGRSKEYDDEVRRLGLEARKDKPITWTKQKCTEELNEILDILKRVLKEDAKLEKDDSKKLKNETIRDVTTLMNKILDYMKYLYPQTQTSVNVNVDVTSDKVIERLKSWKSEQVIEFVPNPVISINA